MTITVIKCEDLKLLRREKDLRNPLRVMRNIYAQNCVMRGQYIIFNGMEGKTTSQFIHFGTGNCEAIIMRS